MSTNISREKREQLLQKLEDLKKYILLREDSEAADAYLPVSYTHLDVYKRQPQERW